MPDSDDWLRGGDGGRGERLVRRLEINRERLFNPPPPYRINSEQSSSSKQPSNRSLSEEDNPNSGSSNTQPRESQMSFTEKALRDEKAKNAQLQQQLERSRQFAISETQRANAAEQRANAHNLSSATISRLSQENSSLQTQASQSSTRAILAEQKARDLENKVKSYEALAQSTSTLQSRVYHESARANAAEGKVADAERRAQSAEATVISLSRTVTDLRTRLAQESARATAAEGKVGNTNSLSQTITYLNGRLTAETARANAAEGKVGNTDSLSQRITYLNGRLAQETARAVAAEKRATEAESKLRAKTVVKATPTPTVSVPVKPIQAVQPVQPAVSVKLDIKPEQMWPPLGNKVVEVPKPVATPTPKPVVKAEQAKIVEKQLSPWEIEQKYNEKVAEMKAKGQIMPDMSLTAYIRYYHPDEYVNYKYGENYSQALKDKYEIWCLRYINENTFWLKKLARALNI